MSRGWVTRDQFRVGPKKRAVARRKAQVQVGPQEFPPPSEEEIQTQIDQIEEATGLIDKVKGYDATLKARFGQAFIDYLEKISDGMHYLLLEGRRPGPPPGFEAAAPEVEIQPERPEMLEIPELGEEGPPPRLPGPAAAMRQPVLISVAKLDDAIADLENLVGQSLEDISRDMRQAGHDPEPVYLLDEAADTARNVVDNIKGVLIKDTADT